MAVSILWYQYALVHDTSTVPKPAMAEGESPGFQTGAWGIVGPSGTVTDRAAPHTTVNRPPVENQVGMHGEQCA
jgi:hypothetical protein